MYLNDVIRSGPLWQPETFHYHLSSGDNASQDESSALIYYRAAATGIIIIPRRY